MIIGFRHKGLAAFYHDGSTRGIQPAHATKLRLILVSLDAATGPQDLRQPGFRLHQLKAEPLRGHWSVWVNGNWRVTFRFVGADVDLVGYEDYH